MFEYYIFSDGLYIHCIESVNCRLVGHFTDPAVQWVVVYSDI